jgi:hypothetical protein
MEPAALQPNLSQHLLRWQESFASFLTRNKIFSHLNKTISINKMFAISIDNSGPSYRQLVDPASVKIWYF